LQTQDLPDKMATRRFFHGDERLQRQQRLYQRDHHKHHKMRLHHHLRTEKLMKVSISYFAYVFKIAVLRLGNHSSTLYTITHQDIPITHLYLIILPLLPQTLCHSFPISLQHFSYQPYFCLLHCTPKHSPTLLFLCHTLHHPPSLPSSSQWHSGHRIDFSLQQSGSIPGPRLVHDPRRTIHALTYPPSLTHTNKLNKHSQTFLPATPLSPALILTLQYFFAPHNLTLPYSYYHCSTTQPNLIS